MSIACRLHSKPAIVKGIPNHNRLSYFFEREDSSSCESTRVSLFFLFCRPTFTVVCWSSFIDAVHIFHERLHEREFGFFLPTQEELIQILKEWWLTSVRYQNKTAQETLFLETESSALSFLLSYDFVDKIHLKRYTWIHTEMSLLSYCEQSEHDAQSETRQTHSCVKNVSFVKNQLKLSVTVSEQLNQQQPEKTAWLPISKGCWFPFRSFVSLDHHHRRFSLSLTIMPIGIYCATKSSWKR